MFADSVMESSSTTGTGSYTLVGAVGYSRTFAQDFSNGDTVAYFVSNLAKTRWEFCTGTLTIGPPRTLTRTVGRLASVDVYGRLVGLFDALAVEQSGQRVVPGPLSQARIAERLGASKAMVNRLLQDLARGGYVEVSRQRIVLLKKLPPRW